jgi:hypothetical protein
MAISVANLLWFSEAHNLQDTLFSLVESFILGKIAVTTITVYVRVVTGTSTTIMETRLAEIRGKDV